MRKMFLILTSFLIVIYTCIREFVYRFILKSGYKDGFYGLVLSLLMCVYRFTTLAKLKIMIEQNNATPRDSIVTTYDDLSSKVIDLEEKVASRANTDDFDFEELQTRITASRERAESPESDSSSFNKIKKVQEESKSSSIERYNDLKAYVKSNKLNEKFKEIDKKTELEQSNEAPAKKQSKGRER